jgi:hypothetical protein
VLVLISVRFLSCLIDLFASLTPDLRSSFAEKQIAEVDESRVMSTSGPQSCESCVALWGSALALARGCPITPRQKNKHD